MKFCANLEKPSTSVKGQTPLAGSDGSRKFSTEANEEHKGGRDKERSDGVMEFCGELGPILRIFGNEGDEANQGWLFLLMRREKIISAIWF